MLKLLDLIKKKKIPSDGGKCLPWGKLGPLEVSMERAEGLRNTNKKLTSLFKDFNLLLAKFRHFQPLFTIRTMNLPFAKAPNWKVERIWSFLSIKCAKWMNRERNRIECHDKQTKCHNK